MASIANASFLRKFVGLSRLAPHLGATGAALCPQEMAARLQAGPHVGLLRLHLMSPRLPRQPLPGFPPIVQRVRLLNLGRDPEPPLTCNGPPALRDAESRCQTAPVSQNEKVRGRVKAKKTITERSLHR